MKIWIPCILACLLFACNNQEEIPAGGGCSYRSEVHPAKLIGFNQVDSINIDAEFEVSWPSAKDTISYYMKKHNYLSAAQIKHDSLVVGNVYQYVEDFIVTGSCNPHITHLEMELIK
jgi:hypothetical protein